MARCSPKTTQEGGTFKLDGKVAKDSFIRAWAPKASEVSDASRMASPLLSPCRVSNMNTIVLQVCWLYACHAQCQDSEMEFYNPK